MKNNDIILNIQNLDIGYSSAKAILSDIRLTANRGELIALIGRNGAGKSTLLRTISKLQKPLSGDIIIDKKNINSFSRNELAKMISFVSTEAININNLKVVDLVSLGRFPHTNWFGKLKVHDLTLINEAISMVSMEDYVNNNVNEISDGERQRVMLARTLAQDTEVIILDEPTAFIDLPNKYEIISILNQLAKNRNKTIIFSTHDLNIAIQQADKIWLMLPNDTHKQKGEIIEGAPEDLILNNTFSMIFDNKKLNFDKTNGDFKIFNQNTKATNRLGLIIEESIEPIYTDWTKKALERLGFEVDCNKSLKENIIIKKDADKIQWLFEKNNDKFVFNSIYELSVKLKASCD